MTEHGSRDSVVAMAVAYLNVDLEIEGPRPLCHILQEFSESNICCLGCFETGRGHFANFEVTALPSDPNSIISEFCDAIETFREDAGAFWAAAHRKTFDVGFDSDGSAGCSRFELKADTVRRAATETLQRIAGVGASVMVAIYPPTRPESDETVSDNRASSYSGSTTTAVPYDRISDAPLMIAEVVNRMSVTALAPRCCASAASRSTASARASSIIVV